MLQDTLTHRQDRHYFTIGKIKATSLTEDVSPCLLKINVNMGNYMYNGV